MRVFLTGSVLTDVANAIADEFTTDVGLLNAGTLLLMVLVLTGRTLWQIVWSLGTLAAYTLLALLRRLPDDFTPSEPEFTGSLIWRAAIVGLTGLLSVIVVQNVKS